MKKIITLLLALAGMVSTASAWNYLKGTFNNWAAESPAYCLVNGPVAVYLTASDTPYEFGINNGGTWKGPNNNATITGTTTISSFGGSGNFLLTVSTSGYYVFSTNWDSGLALTVRYPNTTVYFYNSLGWSNVYLHDGWWNGDNGACNKNAVRGVEMTAGENNIYSAYIPLESISRVTFTSDKQVNDGDGQYGAGYDNFYGTNVVWNSDNFNSSTPIYVPTTTAPETKNSCTYYYYGSFHAYPTYTRTVPANKFGTICLPFAATVTGATVYTIVSKVMRDETLIGINLESVDNLDAGNAYIFKADDGETEITITATYSGSYAATAPDANGMRGNLSSANTNAPQGSYVVSNNQIHLVDGDEVAVGQYRAWVTLTNITAASRGAIFMGLDDESTGIESVQTEKVNGDAIYNLQGQRVKAAHKGLLIVNGKKMLMK